MLKKHPLLIILAAGFILLISGIGSSYYWLTRIYLPDQINSNENALKLKEWAETDQFKPPDNKKVTEEQLNKFLLVNQSLFYFLQNLKHKYNESQWQVVFEFIKMQPSWEGKKYIALKKFNLSPLEYDFISLEVSNYWKTRLKEISKDRLEKSGWDLITENLSETEHRINYDLFLANEDQLNNLFTIFLTPNLVSLFNSKDTANVIADSLP